MAVYSPTTGYPEAIQRVRVQIGDEWTERSTSGTWTIEQSYWIAREMLAGLCGGDWVQNEQDKDVIHT